MKTIVAGIEVELPYTLWFFHHADHAEPVYHAARHDATRKTRCGRDLWAEDYTEIFGVLGLAARHAVRFGRPCVVCWPQLQAQGQLFERPPRSRSDGTTQLRLEDAA